MEVDFLGAGEAAFADAGEEVRGVGLLDFFVQALVEHLGGEGIDQGFDVVGFCDVFRGVAFIGDLDGGVGEFGVGIDGEECVLVIRDGGGGAVGSIGWVGERFEVFADEVFDVGDIVEVADGDDGHEVGAVPLLVEAADGFGGCGVDDLGFSDRQAIGVGGVVEEDRDLFVEDTLLGATAEAPFLFDDAAFFVDFGGVESDGGGPVLKDEESFFKDGGVVEGDFEHVDRFIEAGIGIEVGAEAHTDAFEEVDELVFLEVAGTVESHVFEEVGEALLIVVFED